MLNNDDSVSIRSDEQSLDLECRIMKPKFKPKDYDTYQTETNTSVNKRIMHIKTCSPEYKFKNFEETFYYEAFMLSNRKFSEDTQKQAFVEKANIEQQKRELNESPMKKEKKKKKKTKSGSVYSSKSRSLSPLQPQQLQQIQLQETQSKKSQRSIGKSSTYNKSRKTQGNQQNLKMFLSPEQSPVKRNQKSIFVNHFTDNFKDPIQEKLGLNTINYNSLKDNQLIYNSQRNNLFLSTHQPKGILKCKSVQSESSNGEGSSRYKSIKSSLFKKVTFESNKGQNIKQSLHNQQQLIIIQ